MSLKLATSPLDHVSGKQLSSSQISEKNRMMSEQSSIDFGFEISKEELEAMLTQNSDIDPALNIINKCNYKPLSISLLL